MKTSLLLLATMLILIGCTPQIQYIEINNTINNTITETIIINNTAECVECLDCPAPKVCPPLECDISNFENCKKRETILIARLDYCQEIQSEYMNNNSVYELEANYTACKNRKGELEDLIEDILDLLEDE